MTGIRKNNPEKNKERILKAAQTLFIDLGYDGCSMSRVARKSGVTQSMIHYYFGSKKKLWQEVKEYSFEPLLKERIMPESNKDFSELVRAAIIRRFRFFQEHPEVVKLLSRMQVMNEPITGELALSLLGRWLDIFAHAQKDGLIREDVRPTEILSVYIALTTYWFQSRPLIPKKEKEKIKNEEEAYLSTIIKIFLEGFLVRSGKGKI